MTTCNRCNLKELKIAARNRRQVLTMIDRSNAKGGGTDIYMHPSSVKIEIGVPNSKKDRDKYFVSWMMRIPDKCCC